MNSKHTESELRLLYERWAPFVTMFCKLYLGISQVSESAVAHAFLQYFRDEFAAVDQPCIWSSLQLPMSTVKDDCSRLLKEFDIAPNAAAYTWACLSGFAA